MKLLDGLWRVLRGTLLALAAVVLFIEEWGWEPLVAWAARLATWAPLQRLEARIRRLSPRGALALFLVPAVALFPIKLAALGLIGAGHEWLGIAVIIAAKLLGTAIVGRLFVLTEPQLMHFTWFARALDWWRVTKLRVKAALAASPPVRAIRSLRRRIGLRAARLVAWLRKRLARGS